MQEIKSLLIVSSLLSSLYAGSTRVGNMYLNDDGSSSIRIGGNTFHSDGSSSVQSGSTSFNSGGSYNTRSGNSVYNSNRGYQQKPVRVGNRVSSQGSYYGY